MTMKRFKELFQTHHQDVVPALAAIPKSIVSKGLAYEYDHKAGVVRVYGTEQDQNQSCTEVDPDSDYFRQSRIWYLEEQELSAVVEFLPDYRPRIKVNRSSPLCVVYLKSRPQISGFH
jgi:hypothetical protein